MVQRQDGWSETDDRILAAEVLKRIRSGQTQLGAFQEVAELLNRTASACGFRWNSALRKRYTEEIQQAKLERKERKMRSVLALGSQVEQLNLMIPTQENEGHAQEMAREKEKNQGLESLYRKLCAIERSNEELLQIVRSKYDAVRLENQHLKQKVSDMEKDFRLFMRDYHENYFSNK